VDHPGVGVFESKRLCRFKVLPGKFFYCPCFLLVEHVELQRPPSSQLGRRKALLTAVEKRVNARFSQKFSAKWILPRDSRP